MRWWKVSLLMTSLRLFGGEVRELRSNDLKVEPVYLTLGSSTVLRFSSKPLRAVVGNSNYFNLEFTRNDLSIQALGEVPTNLFVYLAEGTFVFSLEFGSRRDDLVLVKWQDQNVERYRPPEIRVRKIGKKVLGPKKDAEALIDQITYLPKERIWLIDLKLKNLGTSVKTELTLAGHKVKSISGHLVQSDGSLFHRIAFRSDNLGPFVIKLKSNLGSILISLSKEDFAL